jgi:4-amino-4-deoxy-L-arabinose transferase-like glycosyltransferase
MLKDETGWPPRREIWMLLSLLLLGYFLLFHNMGDRYIWSPDEDEYALVNREMVEDGHWIYPTANGEPYGIKPPLFNWIGSFFSLINGEVTEFTSRLPSSLAAMAGVFAIYFLGKLLFGSRAGYLAAMVLATSPLYIEFARWIQINMIWGYSNEQKRKIAYLLMYVPMGLGTLNMGPVNVVMPAIVISLYLIAVKDYRHIFQLRLGWGVVIYLLIVAPWYITVSMAQGYAEKLLITTNLTRYFGKFAHARAFYYYFITTPPNFLPWILYLPGAVYLYFSRQTGDERKQLLFPLIWAAGLFIFYSISKTKRSEYMLPIFPALALLVGYLFDRAFLYWKDGVFWRRLVAWPTYIFLIVCLSAGLGLPLYSWRQAGDWLPIVLPISVLCIICAVVSFILIKKNNGLGAIASVVLLIAGIVTYGSGAVIAKVNDVKSPRSFCLNIMDRIQHDEKLKMYEFYRPVYAFYTHKLIDDINGRKALLRHFKSEKQIYVITREKEYLRLKKSFPSKIYLIHRQWIDHRYVVLMSNRPGQ